MVLVTVGLLLLGAAACDSRATSVQKQDSGGASAQTLTVAYKLAVIDGDPSEEAAFQSAIDCIMASGIKGAETERKVGDTLVASWQASGKQGSLLEWAQAFC
jgi:hypothetical protein